MTFRTALLGATASLLFAGSALADDHAQKSWYVSLGAGLNWIGDDAALGYTSGVRTSTDQFSYDTGHVVAGAIGRDFGTNWRVELEAAFRGNDVDKVCPALTACVASNADVSEFSQMINVVYDVPAAEHWEVSVGAGLGGNLVTASGLATSDIDDYVFAVQILSQVSYHLSDRVRLFADYRHMELGNTELVRPSAQNQSIEIEKADTSLMLGLRYDLQRDAAPKIEEPKPEKPVVEAPKQFIVFFGFNKSNLTAEAVRVVADAAEAAKKHGSASIAIIGHTDTSGSTDYNMALSMRRSQAVKDSLIAHGIDGAMISTAGRGETELMVSTGDGVKEPQNRRATIDLK
jgi:outer membrane protein OmpA-like peptidoglycan-associated protein